MPKPRDSPNGVDWTDHTDPAAGRSLGLDALGRASRLGVLGFVSVGVLEFVLTVVVARGLGATGAGELYAAIAIFMIARSVIQMGPVTGLVRTIAHRRGVDRPQDIQRLLVVAIVPAVGFGTLLAIAGLVILPLTDVFEIVPSTARYLRVMVLTLPFAVLLSLLAAASRGLGSMAPTAAIEQLGVSLSRVALMLVAIHFGFDDTGIGLAWSIPFVLFVPPLWWKLWSLITSWSARSVDASSEPEAYGKLARELWAFSSVRGFAAVLQQGVRWIDIPLVAALASPATAGVYAAISRLAMAGTVGLRGLVLAIGPHLSEIMARGHHRLARRRYRTSTHWAMVISFPIFIALAAYPSIFLGVFGPDFQIGSRALQILAFASMVNVATGPIQMVLLLKGRASLNVVNAATSLTLNLGLNLLLIPRLGIEGAALAWAASITFENIAPLVQLRRLGGYHPIGRGFGLILTACASSFGLVGVLLPRLLGLTSAAGLLVFAVAGSALYGSWLWRARTSLDLSALTGAITFRGGGNMEELRPPS